MTSFMDILSKRGDDVKPPPPLPPGHYVWVARDFRLQEPRSEDQNGAINFFCNAVQALDDVDTDRLPENWKQKNVRLTFWIGEDTAFIFTKQFAMEALGVDGNLSISDMIPHCLNKPFVAECRHRARKDTPEILDEDLRSYKAVE